jgi:hypothetical protein
MASIRRIENALGNGLILGLGVGLLYWLLSCTRFLVALPFIAGVAVAMTALGLFNLLPRNNHSLVKILSVLASGTLGGLCSFALFNGHFHIVWFLAGGAVIFLAVWHAEVRPTL